MINNDWWWSTMIDSDRDDQHLLTITIDDDRRWSTMTDEDWCWSTMINHDWRWSMMIHYDLQLLMIINKDLWWPMMINEYQWYWKMINDEWWSKKIKTNKEKNSCPEWGIGSFKNSFWFQFLTLESSLTRKHNRTRPIFSILIKTLKKIHL